uniref:NADH-ubiquinone oxidoreductase chain 6 n=1 Tax=Scolopsis ciliata TaxID=119746 RepID=A0A4Y5WYY8_SCOCI|nr:NADH dehydrogenase subunit 6 [Scolopsis ciliata]QDE13214.1 NADH dehydrogenase subunit 6 [Scolopsis ciliata]QQY98724.1 NADH dehydrogenase subunit 6 [Scolopsis ciliata]
MSYILFVLLLGLVGGLATVASNPSPYFAALGLVLVAGLGCGVLVGCGGTFLSLVLFLIYLGGMIVVFAYSAALAAEPYPETLGSRRIVLAILFYCFMALLGGAIFWTGWSELSWMTAEESEEFSVFRGDAEGIATIYSSGSGMLLIGGWVLLLTLFVVLELVRGLGRGTVRAV